MNDEDTRKIFEALITIRTKLDRALETQVDHESRMRKLETIANKIAAPMILCSTVGVIIGTLLAKII